MPEFIVRHTNQKVFIISSHVKNHTNQTDPSVLRPTIKEPSTHPNLLVFCTGREVLSIRAEAHAANVQVSGLGRRFVNEDTSRSKIM